MKPSIFLRTATNYHHHQCVFGHSLTFHIYEVKERYKQPTNNNIDIHYKLHHTRSMGKRIFSSSPEHVPNLKYWRLQGWR